MNRLKTYVLQYKVEGLDENDEVASYDAGSQWKYWRKTDFGYYFRSKKKAADGKYEVVVFMALNNVRYAFGTNDGFALEERLRRKIYNWLMKERE